ncbi:unnamed protein product [Durusdinium trenchii]|uniref:IC97/Casc1 N-terminal domain-containing protein n=1 Tax=Durusdinium trenchii TaxID=1381693 RepID=A0ABP0IWC2_9DINO
MPKTKKKSKKQLEDELQKAAEEQKRQEEKERLFKLEEDALAAHRERLEIELEGKNRVLEAERLEEEQEMVVRMKGERKRCLDYEQSKLQEKIEWQKFVSCTSRPNVMFESEITTYVTMVREERSDRESVETAIEKCKAAEEVVGDLLELYCKACEEGNVTRQDWCMHYIGEIRDLEVELIDAATAHLLLYIEKQEPNTHLQVYLQWGNANDNMKVGFWGHLQSKGFRAKSIEHSKIQIGLDLPKAIQLQSIGHCIGVRSLYTTFDSAQGKDPVQMSIGGMIRVDLLSIPPFSKKVKGWTIRQVPAPGKELMKLPYPNTEHTTASTAIAAPCKIDYKVPSHVLVSKNPVVSWWDASVERWSTEGISEITWEQESRKISFFTARLASFSITQERHSDLPYKHWNMRPCDDMVVELTVQAARYELRFMISEDGLRLKGPQLPELLDVMFEPGSGEAGGLSGPSGRRPRIRSPATLLNELRECGLNLMPKNSDADQLEGYTPKHPETQARAYSDLSEIAAFYDIASSRHNKDLPAERALVRIRENELHEVFNPLDADGDNDYQAIMFFPDKCCHVQSLEGISPCREAMAPGHFTHASLYLCFEKDPSPGPAHSERLQRLEVTTSTVRFVEAVRQTMQLMHLLSFV